MSTTSSNHAEIFSIHEESQECVWLRSVIQYTRESCGISSGHEAPTIVHEDNATCIAQLKNEYIKGDRTKHILPKFFFTHDLQKSGDIIVQQVRSSDNLADLLSEALHAATFKKLVHGIRTQCGDSMNLSDLIIRGRIYTLHSFSLRYGFFPLVFPSKIFNVASHLRSGSAWKAYMNARVTGLFLLVLLEYPNGKGVDETSEPLLYAGWMAGPYRCNDDATRGQNDDPVTSGIKAGWTEADRSRIVQVVLPKSS
nr:retrovirus-related Pol polyprotein from transposon TNT 1-94 [Tanacetum cinerariifolium]